MPLPSILFPAFSFFALALHLDAADEPTRFEVGPNREATVMWPQSPAIEKYRLLQWTNLSAPSNDVYAAATLSTNGYRWSSSNDLPHQFLWLETTPLSSNALLTATVLNRLTYGPTPDELERIYTGPFAIGPQAFIEEQLAPEYISETIDSYTSEVTNSVPQTGPNTNWVYMSVTGTVTSAELYLYLNKPGEAYIDDLVLVAGRAAGVGPNLIQNGDFETPLSPPWTVSPNHIGSHISTTVKRSGNGSLHMIATAGGSTKGSSIWQAILPTLTNLQPCTLGYWYLPSTNSSSITIRLSGNNQRVDGLVSSAADEPETPEWIYVSSTGPATARTLYFYLNGAGEAYIDDVKLVAGTVAEAGVNVLQNGDFELPFPAPYWQVSTNLINSHQSTTIAHSGNGSLHVVATREGSTQATSIYQTNIPVVLNATYTLSYWYIPAKGGQTFTARLSGSGINSTPDQTLSGINRRLDDGLALLRDLRAWYCANAVGSKRQLYEILTQFLENHFVTQHAKSRDYFDQFYDGSIPDRLATDFEFREISKWRACLASPTCTFRDLLRISAESPAQIIYLDTVNSKGNGNNIANENYARELLELYTMGVDNGYDQNDIVQMSRCWTGWSVDIVDAENLNNPFAARSGTYIPGVSSGARSNLVGVWTFVYNQANHYTNSKTIFSTTNGSKVYPARFGPLWAGKPYQLVLPRRNGTAGIQDGYEAVNYLADLPFTQEYISVKLCRLFVHDDFEHGVYDYSDPDALSLEGRLIHECMLAWENSTPKGQIRAVLNTIFNSELFRSHGGALQKVKTPFEFTVSAVRALRSANANGSFTATTDGYSFESPLNRMGGMSLFNRGDPDGYPEAAPGWISAGTLAERLRYVQALLTATGTGRPSDAGNNATDPVALLKKKIPSTSSWNDANAVADFFTGILYPGEGKANLELYRKTASTFLNTGDDGVSASPLASLSNTSAAYDTRVRGMVAMLMSFQRFQEQ